MLLLRRASVTSRMDRKKRRPQERLSIDKYEKRSISGSLRLHVAPGIYGRIVHTDFIVNVRTRGASADSGVAHNLAPLNTGARHGSEGRQMGVPRGDAEAVVYNHNTPVAGMVFSDRYDAVSGGVNRCAVIRGHVHAGVERSFPAEWIEPLAKSIGDVAEHRPNGGCVARVRKARYRDEAQAAAVNGDGRGISFQKCVLLNSAVKSILGGSRVVG